MYKGLFKDAFLLFLSVFISNSFSSYANGVSVNKEKWEEERSAYKFKKLEEKEEKESKPIKPIDFKPIIIPPFVKWAAIAVAIGLLIYLLIKVLGLDRLSFNKKNTNAKQINIVIEDLTKEEFIKTEFEQLQEQAAANGDYRLAHRYLFLHTLQLLQKNNYIKWGRDKTNHDYLFHTMGEAFYPSFSSLVTAFELVWYGDRVISLGILESISKEHLGFNQLIKSD